MVSPAQDITSQECRLKDSRQRHEFAGEMEFVMRARNIKPGFFKNECLIECTPLARVLFIGLWCMADREGRIEDRPKRIKLDVLPGDECNVDDLLNELAHIGKAISRYEVNGVKVIQVLNFHKHQRPHHNEPKSELPKISQALATKVESACDQIDKHFALNDECGMMNDVCLKDEPTDTPSEEKQKPVCQPASEEHADPLKAAVSAKKLIQKYREEVTAEHSGGTAAESAIRKIFDEHPHTTSSDLARAIAGYAEHCKVSDKGPKFRFNPVRFFGEGHWQNYLKGPPTRVPTLDLNDKAACETYAKNERDRLARITGR